MRRETSKSIEIDVDMEYVPSVQECNVVGGETFEDEGDTLSAEGKYAGVQTKERNEAEYTNKLLLENFALKEKLRKCEAKLAETERELRISKGLPAVPIEKKIFHNFTVLPPELRYMVYCRFTLSERAAAARSSAEMKAFFEHNRMKESGEVHMDLRDSEGTLYVRFLFFDHEYAEEHKVPDRLVTQELRTLVAQGKDCHCEYCYYYCSCDLDEIRVFEYKDQLPQSLFQTLLLVEIEKLLIVTDPVGGLVDLVQPSYHLNTPKVQIEWHNPDGVQPISNDPRLNIENWRKWMDFMNADEIIFSKGEKEESSSSDSDDSSEDSDNDSTDSEAPFIYIHKKLYDLQAIQNAKTIKHENCAVVISDDQLFSLKATTLDFDCFMFTPHLVSGTKLLLFYQQKLEQWMNSPHTKFSFKLKADDCLHLNKRRMFENVLKQIYSTRYVVYERLNVLNREDDYDSSEDYTIRHRKTGSAFVVSRDEVWSGIPEDENVWPDNDNSDN